MFNKKAQTGGLITGLVFGVASLIIAVIIAFVITSTLSDANLLAGGRDSSTTNNETAHINGSSYQLAALPNNLVPGSISVTLMLNRTNLSDNEIIPAGNYSISSLGNLTNVTTTSWNNVSISTCFSSFFVGTELHCK